MDISFKRKQHPAGFKGEYDPGSLEVIVYLPQIESRSDKDITILHEFVHARDDVKAARQDKLRRGADNELEDAVEKEAVETYQKRAYVLEFIKQLYRIR